MTILISISKSAPLFTCTDLNCLHRPPSTRIVCEQEITDHKLMPLTSLGQTTVDCLTLLYDTAIQPIHLTHHDLPCIQDIYVFRRTSAILDFRAFPIRHVRIGFPFQLQYFRMPMDTRHHAHTNTPPYRPCNPSLIHGSQPCLPRMLDTSHRRHIFRHDREVLCIISTPASIKGRQEKTNPIIRHGIEVQDVKNIHKRPAPFLPLSHLHRAEIVRCIYIALLPSPRNLLAQIRAQSVPF